MKVLIVDDEPLVRRSLQKAFALSGHQVITCEDGKTGLAMWEKESPDLVLLDVLMPGLTGPQVIEKIAPELKSRTKIVVISAYAGDFNESLKSNKNFDQFIAKPFDDIMQIVRMCEDLCGAQRHGS